MPLLLCPNDNASMTTVKRGGVEFDMCPTCRGVWLDRGELEKLMAGGEAPSAAAPYRPEPEYRPQPEYRRKDYDDDDRRYEHGYKKKKRLDIFDIFD